MENIEISTGEMAVAGDKNKIVTHGIGSCMTVCLYDETKKIGGMIHAMLPTRQEEDKKILTSQNEQGRYVDEAVTQLVEAIERKGGKKERLTAKIVGGASMFKIFSDKIGTKNINSAKKILSILNIPIVKEATGGTVGRSAVFDTGNGIVEVVIKM